jgi:Tol biopolymer transport system component
MKSLVTILTMLCAPLALAKVTLWQPPVISSDRFESHAAFDPLTDDFIFVRSAPDFSGWRLYVSHCSGSGWTTPTDVPFAGDGVEADPSFSKDGHTLYFISSRTTDGVQGRNLDLWRVTRDAALKWGTPERLPEPLNSTGREWFPRMAADGWLWFGSDRAGAIGKTDIWRAREVEPGRWTVQNAGPEINSAGNEYEAEMSPDGKRLLVMTDDAMYESTFDGARWSPRRKLPPEINVNGSEIGALFSPSGRSLLFSRDTKGPKSGEFHLWRDGAEEKWPPACPRSRG